MPDPAINVPSFDLPTIERLVRHYQALQGLDDWTFEVSIVPGLTFKGAPAWAIVDSKPNPDGNGGHADIAVRDIRATPIPNFDGDPWHEIKVTISHELWHPHVTRLLAEPTVENEERLVEAAAQAVVRSERSKDDARVMARSIKAIPSALRARVAQISASATRSRGGQMDPKAIANLAMKAGELAAAEGTPPEIANFLKELVAALASGGAPAEAAPPSSPEGAPRAGDGAPVVDGGDPMAKDAARARKAADELEAMAQAVRPAAKESLFVGLRARLGAALTPAVEAEIKAEIMRAPDFAAAQTLAKFAETLVASGAGAQRARSGVEHEQRPPPEQSGPPTVDALRAQGFTESWLTGYVGALRAGPEVAAAYHQQGLKSARARVAQPNGGR